MEAFNCLNLVLSAEQEGLVIRAKSGQGVKHMVLEDVIPLVGDEHTIDAFQRRI
jgi:hypothetical protein